MQGCFVTQFTIRKRLLKKLGTNLWQFASRIAFSTDNTPVGSLLHVTVLEQYYEITVSMQVLAVRHFMGMVDTEIPTEM